MAFLIPYSVQLTVVFVFGCVLGSFYNVVISRLPAGESIVWPGSRCPGCRHPIAFFDNIPLLSYVLLRGRCRHCQAGISVRYPLVEFLAGLLATLLFHMHGLSLQFLMDFFFTSLLLIIAFIDLDTFLIPDMLSLPGILVGFGFSLFSIRIAWSDSLLGIFLGGGLFCLIAAGYRYLRHQEGLGVGDIKLLGMIGAFLGWPGVVFTIFVSSLTGSLVGFIAMWRSGKGMSTMVPFGPFLSLGAVCYLFFGEGFFRWYWGYFS